MPERAAAGPRAAGAARASTPDARPLLAQALTSSALSARAYDRVLRVARTIADLDGAEQTAAAHVAEALQYQGPDSALLS